MDSVVHFEITADDLQRAKKFYAKAFGWKLTDVPEMDYIVAHTTETSKQGMPKTRGTINGGIAKKDQSASSPVVVMRVKSITKSVPKIQKLGGQIVMPKTKVGEMGYYARVKDTEGNVIGVWEDIPPKNKKSKSKK